LHALTDGLWSANRGLARQRDRYHQCLSEADMARQGDMDGRGATSASECSCSGASSSLMFAATRWTS
jgi:hypothetical protein